jgi:hypothetical protein
VSITSQVCRAALRRARLVHDSHHHQDSLGQPGMPVTATSAPAELLRVLTQSCGTVWCRCRATGRCSWNANASICMTTPPCGHTSMYVPSIEGTANGHGADSTRGQSLPETYCAHSR